jgi:hypothetical protein
MGASHDIVFPPPVGLSFTATGLLVSIVGTLLLFVHTTNEYHSSIQDIGSIAVAYLGLVILGVSISVTGVGVLLRTTAA